MEYIASASSQFVYVSVVNVCGWDAAAICSISTPCFFFFSVHFVSIWFFLSLVLVSFVLHCELLRRGRMSGGVGTWDWWNQERNHGIHLVLSLWLCVHSLQTEAKYAYAKEGRRKNRFHVPNHRPIRCRIRRDNPIVWQSWLLRNWERCVTSQVIFLHDRNHYSVISMECAFAHPCSSPPATSTFYYNRLILSVIIVKFRAKAIVNIVLNSLLLLLFTCAALETKILRPNRQ